MVFWTGAAVIVLVLGGPTLISIALDPGDRAVHFFQRLFGRLQLAWLRACGVRVRIEGAENFPSGRSHIIASNHESLVDIFALSAAQPPHTRWVVKRELKMLPIVGWAIRLGGFVFVDRRGVPDSVQQSFSRTQRDLSQPGRTLNLLFFPEGTRTRDGRLRPFKKGAFRMAAEWKLPIVPVAIRGSFRLLPRGWFARLRAGAIRVRVLPPILPEEAGEWTERALLERTRSRIAEALVEAAGPGERAASGGDAPTPKRIEEAADLRPDERWLRARELFDRLYSGPGSVPFVHRPCEERVRPAQYLRRLDGDRIGCPVCGAELCPELVAQLGLNDRQKTAARTGSRS